MPVPALAALVPILVKAGSAIATAAGVLWAGAQIVVPMAVAAATPIVAAVSSAGTVVFVFAGKILVDFSKAAYHDMHMRAEAKSKAAYDKYTNSASKDQVRAVIKDADQQDARAVKDFSRLHSGDVLSAKDQETIIENYLTYVMGTYAQLKGCIDGLKAKGIEPDAALVKRFEQFRAMRDCIKEFDEIACSQEADGTPNTILLDKTHEFVQKEKTRAEALLDIFDLDQEVAEMDSVSAFVYLDNTGLPLEVTTRLTALWDETCEIEGTKIHIGKIIVVKLLDFVMDHKIGLAGAVAGGVAGYVLVAGLQYLLSIIPFVGPIIGSIIGYTLGPLVTVIGAAIGSTFDSHNATAGQALYNMARDFFSTLVEIFKLLKDDLRGTREALQAPKIKELSGEVIDIPAVIKTSVREERQR